jgi:hypothetical protein
MAQPFTSIWLISQTKGKKLIRDEQLSKMKNLIREIQLNWTSIILCIVRVIWYRIQEKEKEEYLKRVDGATVRGNDVFVIGELESADSIGLNATCERFWAQLARFSVSDLLPHFPSIFWFFFHFSLSLSDSLSSSNLTRIRENSELLVAGNFWFSIKKKTYSISISFYF